MTVTFPFTVSMPVAVCVKVTLAAPPINVSPVQVFVLLIVFVAALLKVIVPKAVVPVPLIVLDTPVNIIAGVPVRVPPLFNTFPLAVMVKPPEANVPCRRLRLFTVKAAPSVAVPEALLIVR